MTSILVIQGELPHLSGGEEATARGGEQEQSLPPGPFVSSALRLIVLSNHILGQGSRTPQGRVIAQSCRDNFHTDFRVGLGAGCFTHNLPP